MDLDQLEAFALGEDREKALDQLIPGTEDFYYYKCLLLQHSRELKEVEPLLETWASRYGWTERALRIQKRQALLAFDEASPDRTFEILCDDLDLRFDHQRESEAWEHTYPTSLDSESISRSAFEREVKAHDSGLSSYTDLALDWLLDVDLDPHRRRELLTRLRHPEHPRLVEQVIADLDAKDSKGFGSLRIHGLLFLDQLEEMAKRRPELLDVRSFVTTWVSRLQPGTDVDWEHDSEEREAYLGRLWAFVEGLSSSFNSLKVHVLFHRLEHDRSIGGYDKNRFMAYLGLPRQVRLTPRRVLRHPKHRHSVADLSAQFQPHTLLPPVVDDEPLVRDYLANFLVDADDMGEFSGLIRDDELQEIFAETKLLAGRGDPERWTAMLDPARYQSLKERVDIEITPQNRPWFRADDPVTIEVDIKNVQTLLVKVFEINTLNAILTTGREVDTSVDLDGMVAGFEAVHSYDEAPLRRKRQSFSFDELRKPGVYVVELIGGGKSSRALIRKGALSFLERISAAGHVFTILDENGHHLQDASLWLGGREYRAGEDGTILVPFSTSPRRVEIVLRHGDLATLESFDHRDERYTFEVGIHIDREQLISRRKARVIVRPELSIHGVPLDLSLIEKPILHVLTTDRRAIDADLDIPVELPTTAGELVQEFTVPEDLANLSITLSGTVRSVTEQKDIELLDGSEDIRINEIDNQAYTEDIHFSSTDRGYVLYLLGKSGEPRCAKPVNLSIRHLHFKRDLHFTLQTDDRGRIELGDLEDIGFVLATSPSGVSENLVPLRPWCWYPKTIHGCDREPIEIPLPDTPKRAKGEISLLEQRGGGFLRSCPDAVTIGEGTVVIGPLPAGDYQLFLKRRRVSITLRVIPGVKQSGWVVAERRMLELGRRKPLLIRRVESTDEKLTIHLGNAKRPDTRVHVIATRFAPSGNGAQELSFREGGGLGSASLSKPLSHYVSGRDIGDEYRYILERKYAPAFAGAMVPRPGLLLNPWAISTTETEREEPLVGGAYAPSPARQAMARKASKGRERASQSASTGGKAFANLDFLASQSVLLTNLRPDEAGLVSVKRAAFSSAASVQVVAIDSDGAVCVDHPLSESNAPHRDVRLLPGLESCAHFTEQKEVTTLQAGDELVIEDISTASVESFESLCDVFNLFVTLCRSEHLETFRFVLDWPRLSDIEQRAKYSEHACHELNLFLYFKDRPFFDRVVDPYLQNKLHKTFVDHFLLGDDLREYREPWSFGRLNLFERIILSWRIPEEREALRRHVDDLFNCLVPDAEEEDRLFTAALKSRGPGGGGLGFAEAQDQRVMAKAEMAGQGGQFATNRSAPMASAAPMGGPQAPPPAPPAPAQAFGMSASGMAVEEPEMSESLAMEAFEDDEAEDYDGLSRRSRRDIAARDEVRRLYRRQDKTQEWAENNYYKLRLLEQGPELIAVNAFWKDLASHDPMVPFLSSHFPKASRNFAEVMCALAVLDLPFDEAEHEVSYDEGRMLLAAKGPVVVFHKEIESSELPAQRAPLMISQSYLRADDRYIYDGSEYREKHVTGELLVHTVYECQVVLTNPTSARQKIQLLQQIPAGSVPVANGFVTRGRQLILEPFSTEQITYSFYFPFVGEYSHFPAHAADGEELLAAADAATLTVVEVLGDVDTESWAYLSQHGDDDQVLRYLDKHNIERIDLDRIAWRMKDPSFYRSVIEVLRQRHVFNHTLWSYSLGHSDVGASKEFLRYQDDLLRECGPWLDSSLLTIDPVNRGWYEHLEYSPLVNARAHQLGGRTTVLNDAFERQYRQFLDVLCSRASIADEDNLAAAYYFLLQDRVDEAMKSLEKVHRAALASHLQYDYLAACLALHQGKAPSARQLAEPHADHPVDRWRQLFQCVLAAVDEAEGASIQVTNKDDREAEQTRLSDTEASFDLSVEKGAVTLTYQNLTECTVSYYLMDIELLFSRQPFVQQQAERFSIILPNRTEAIQLPEDRDELTFDIPDDYRSQNIIVEVIAQGQRKVEASYANKLSVQVVHQYGQVRVSERGARTSVIKAYVKVYSRNHAGKVSFYKDGYTDIRGRFDYATLSTDDIDTVERFAILVHSDELGAVVTEAPKPAM